MGRPHFGSGRHHPPSIDRNSRGESWGCWPIEMPDGMPPLFRWWVRTRSRVNISFYAHMERNNPKPKPSSRVLSTPVDKRRNACSVPEELECCRILVSLSSVIVVHRRGRLRVVPLVFLSRYAFGEWGTGVSSSQAIPPLLYVYPSISTHAIPVTSYSPVSSYAVFILLHFQTFPSWVLPGRVSRFRYFTSSVVLLVSHLGS